VHSAWSVLLPLVVFEALFKTTLPSDSDGRKSCDVLGRSSVPISRIASYLASLKEALDSGSTGAMPEALDQLDELLASLGSSTETK